MSTISTRPPEPKPADPRPRVSRGTLEGYETVALAAGELEAAFAPRLGMVGVSLKHRGDELLDRREGLAAYADQGAVMGIPLLHPWANRLAAHDYTIGGRDVRLAGGSPHVHCEEHGLPIHGLLNGSPHWELTTLNAARDRASLSAMLDFAAQRELLAAFPFSHELHIDVSVEASGLTVCMALRPSAQMAVPIAFGFHPYLRLPDADRADWELRLPARRHLNTDGRGIPTGGGEMQPAARLQLGDRAFDDGYDGLPDGTTFCVSNGDRTITLTLISGYPAAQIFSPAGAQFICFEPMTAPTNALRSERDSARSCQGAASPPRSGSALITADQRGCSLDREGDAGRFGRRAAVVPASVRGVVEHLLDHAAWIDCARAAAREKARSGPLIAAPYRPRERSLPSVAPMRSSSTGAADGR